MAPPTVRARLTRALALAAAVALPLACSSVTGGTPWAGSTPWEEAARPDVANNVIFLLGDGMGEPHREFLRLAIAGPDGELAMDRLDVTGEVDTASAGDEVTDSAAAATAFATGERTSNGSIGVDEDGEPLTTVLELARDAGKATGLVTTSQVTDASPAAFAAHVSDREQQGEIAEQYLEDTGVDVILGGGEQEWRSDEDDLVEEATELGYTHVSDAAELAAASGDRLLGLFADEEMFEPGDEGEGRYEPEVPLADMTRAALDALDGADGFFLVVEEEGTDEMSHHNNAELLLEAGRAFDAAVEAALAFQSEHPDTLIVVAGDHETGGMEVTVTDPGSSPEGDDGPFPVAGSAQQLWVDWDTEGHTDAPTPITADGPGADAFEGGIRNTQVFTGLTGSMGLGS